MHAASQLPGRGPLMWMMPLHLHIIQKSDYDMTGHGSETFYISLLTVLTPCMSRPLAARSVASNTSTSASLNFCNASNL